MKALTISQPYASLIADGEKFVENRTWPTRYRGLLAIHAGKGTQYLDRKELAAYPNGCIIALAVLRHCLPLAAIVRAASERIGHGYFRPEHMRFLEQHEHTEGPWCWVLTDINKLASPIPCRGSQGIWDFNGRLATEVFMNGEYPFKAYDHGKSVQNHVEEE